MRDSVKAVGRYLKVHTLYFISSSPYVYAVSLYFISIVAFTTNFVISLISYSSLIRGGRCEPIRFSIELISEPPPNARSHSHYIS